MRAHASSNFSSRPPPDVSGMEMENRVELPAESGGSTRGSGPSNFDAATLFRQDSLDQLTPRPLGSRRLASIELNTPQSSSTHASSSLTARAAARDDVSSEIQPASPRSEPRRSDRSEIQPASPTRAEERTRARDSNPLDARARRLGSPKQINWHVLKEVGEFSIPERKQPQTERATSGMPAVRSYPPLESIVGESLYSTRDVRIAPRVEDETFCPETKPSSNVAYVASTTLAASIHYLVSFGACYAAKVGLQAVGAPHPQLIIALSGPLHRYGEDLTKTFRIGAITPAAVPPGQSWIKTRAKRLVAEDLPFFYFTALYILSDTQVRPRLPLPKESNGHLRNDTGLDIPVRLAFGMLAAALTALTVQCVRYMQGGTYKRVNSSARKLRYTSTFSALKSPKRAADLISDSLGRGASLLPVAMYGIGHFSTQNLLVRNLVPNTVLIAGWVLRSDLKGMFESALKPIALGLSTYFESSSSGVIPVSHPDEAPEISRSARRPSVVVEELGADIGVPEADIENQINAPAEFSPYSPIVEQALDRADAPESSDIENQIGRESSRAIEVESGAAPASRLPMSARVVELQRGSVNDRALDTQPVDREDIGRR